MTTEPSLVAITPQLPVVPVQPLDQHPAAVYLASLAAGSRRTMRGALDTIADDLVPGADARSFPWQELRYQHTAAVRATLAARLSPATANKMLSALRGVLRTCRRLGLMSAEDATAAADLPPVRGSTLPRGRGLSAGELRALFHACSQDPTPAGRRDAAIVAVAYGAGLRRSEVVGLTLEDVDLGSGALTVRAGKGRKDRVSYLAAGARAALLSYLPERGEEPGPLFWPVDRWGHLRPGSLSTQGVLRVCRRRAREANVASFSPHDLRRSAISDLLDAGADISTVAGLAGHSQVTTTARYDRRGERAKQQAAGLLHVPFTAA
jgi:integrase